MAKDTGPEEKRRRSGVEEGEEGSKAGERKDEQ
jgi:hypothetical protein